MGITGDGENTMTKNTHSKTNKTRRQQLGMPERWRLLEKLDPTVIVLIPDEDYMSNDGLQSSFRRLGFARKSQVEELKKQYGDDLEVL